MRPSPAKNLQDHLLQSVSATITGTHRWAFRDWQLSERRSQRRYFIQRSSYNNNFSGGLNLDGTVALVAYRHDQLAMAPGMII